MRPAFQDASAGDLKPTRRRGVSVARRMVYALALVPVVPASAIAVFSLLDAYLALGEWYELSLSVFIASLVCVVGSVLIWRRLVPWTLRQSWLTALLSTIPFILALYVRPLWNVQRGEFDLTPIIMYIGQWGIGVGAWVWLMIWVWWGLEKRKMSVDTLTSAKGMRMTPTAKRLAASIGLIPFVVGSYLIINAAIEDFGGLYEFFAGSFACTALVAIVVWILIWRRVVAWSAVVVMSTALIAVFTLALPIVAVWLLYDRHELGLAQTGLLCLPIIGWGLWMALTIGLWPISRSEGGKGGVTPACLTCGYPLIGLRSTRCPECGDEPTLDQLWIGNVGDV